MEKLSIYESELYKKKIEEFKSDLYRAIFILSSGSVCKSSDKRIAFFLNKKEIVITIGLQELERCGLIETNYTLEGEREIKLKAYTNYDA